MLFRIFDGCEIKVKSEFIRFCTMTVLRSRRASRLRKAKLG